MAKNSKKAGPSRRGGRSGKSRMGNTYVLSILALVVLGLVVFATPAFVVFAVGIIPSLVAAVIDREPGRNATIAVTATNFAGVAPFVIELLMSGATTGRAIGMINDVFVLAVMYGTAAIGWALVLGMPKVAAVYISVSNDAKSQAMQREQRRLIEDWGEDVTEAPAPRKKRKTETAASPA
jgi:hypothetical protein